MKRILTTVVVVLLAIPAYAAKEGNTYSVGQRGYYGRIDVDDYPQPRLVNTEPVIIEQHVAPGRPLYLHVPPGHIRAWKEHCGQYDACGRSVHFVDNDWYDKTYVPAYEKKHGNPNQPHAAKQGHEPKQGKDQGQGKKPKKDA